MLEMLLIFYGFGAVVMLFIIAGVIRTDYRAGVVPPELYGWIVVALIGFMALWPVIVVYLIGGIIVELVQRKFR